MSKPLSPVATFVSRVPAAVFYGKTVSVRHDLSKDREYVEEMRVLRSSHGDQEAKVFSHSSGHGLCFTVVHPDGSHVAWEPDELFIDPDEITVRFVMES